MCFPHDARPPITPIAGAAIDSEDLVLKSKDGTQFAAFAARAENPSGAGIVVMPDVRGLYPYYEELAMRFAEEGINAVAFDYFGRTAGVAKRDENFDFMPEVKATKSDKIAEDVRACIDYLKSPEGGSCSSVFTIGFCFGGSNSWLQAAWHNDLSGAIGFYGIPGPSFADGTPGPIDRAPEMNAPILALMGGADQAIGPDQVQALDKAFKDNNVKAEVITYEGAPHSFFDRHYEQYANESADAWRRCLEFVRSNAK
ncbi:MAG: dienelactone hydrolase family protein [Dehalococcoidia bacterium]|nr:dienelactone hydrolase family protein [Dehalococcoidia bacterium]